MSVLREHEGTVTAEEVIEYVKRRIEELERELAILRSLLVMLGASETEEPIDFDPNEKTEEVKISRKVIAVIGIGSDYVRVVPKFQASLPREVEDYLASVVEEIAERQARQGVEEEERASLEVRAAPSGEVREIRITRVTTPLEKVKAKAALKYVMELTYQISRKSRKQA